MTTAIKTLGLAALAIITGVGDALAGPAGERGAPQGYSVGNFGIAAVISENGLNIDKSLINPPELGKWLAPFGVGELKLRVAGHDDFKVISRYAVFPENAAHLRSPATGIDARIDYVAPLGSGAGGSFNNFIPAVVIQVTLTNHGARSQIVDLSYGFSVDPANSAGPLQFESLNYQGIAVREVHQPVGPAQWWLMAVPDARSEEAIRSAAGSVQPPMSLALPVHLGPRQTRSVAFAIGVYDPRGYPAIRLSSRGALEEYLLSQGLQGQSGGLKQQQAEFVAALPRTGDAAIDLYARWYLSAAVLLTKGLATGDVLTMGYKELNQRDSFWTSGAHLIYWPHLELKMLRESMAAQSENGQIPLCILPVIDRENNIDGNEYFILRVARYYRWHRDSAFLKEALPHVKRAIDYLLARDEDKIGLPKQLSYWADWKDVSGVENRTYAPHFELLWLASLKEAKWLAQEAADTSFETNLRALYDTAFERINRTVEQGGLWNGSHYVDRWKDGHAGSYTLEDQTVGAVFDVIPRERLDSIYAALDNANESPFGVRETYPYLPKFDTHFGPGEYHNGGVWPWLNFADAWGRFKNGHAVDAERLLKKVGFNDLVRFNDFAPGEYAHGETGENKGFAVQGWDADFVSALYFGAFGLERIGEHELAVHVNLRTRDFKTRIRVPEGDLILTRTNGAVAVEKQLMRPLRVRILPDPLP